MNIEHIAINVADPWRVADWYVRHLGLQVARKGGGPVFGHFLADSAGKVVLEIYHQNAPVPDYASIDPFVFHIAFITPDVAADRARLIAAGGKADGGINHAPNGDVLCFVRDPWGIVIQLARRSTPLLESQRLA
jgi:catechol 2,3-dioxygenase-like lactoylglutathione lyase family enzyme